MTDPKETRVKQTGLHLDCAKMISFVSLAQGSAIWDPGIPNPGFFVNDSQIPIPDLLPTPGLAGCQW